VYGEHAVRLDSPYDQIRLEHRAKSRRGFAEGALRSAEWLLEQPPGLYRLEDMLGDWLDDAR
jgi:4-hydroxy-tetrahydrodipicolinate reductase